MKDSLSNVNMFRLELKGGTIMGFRLVTLDGKDTIEFMGDAKDSPTLERVEEFLRTKCFMGKYNIEAMLISINRIYRP